MLPHGPGVLADPASPLEKWGGRKAQAYVDATLAEYGTICYLCGISGANSADHVVPISKGGAVYDLANLGPAHRKCNYSRGNRESKPITAALIVEDGSAYFTKE